MSFRPYIVVCHFDLTTNWKILAAYSTVQYVNKMQPLLKLSYFTNIYFKNILIILVTFEFRTSDRAPHNIISRSLGPLPERYNDIISISQKNYIQYAWGNIISISLKVSNKNKQKKHGVFCFFFLHCFRSFLSQL